MEEMEQNSPPGNAAWLYEQTPFHYTSEEIRLSSSEFQLPNDFIVTIWWSDFYFVHFVVLKMLVFTV